MEEVHSPPPHLQPDGESSRVSAGGAIPSRSRSAQHQLRRVSSTSLGRLPAPQLDPRSRSADRRATDSLLVQAPTRQPRDNKRFVALPLDFREEEEELEEGAQEALGLIEGSPAAGDGTDDKQLQQHTEPDFAGGFGLAEMGGVPDCGQPCPLHGPAVRPAFCPYGQACPCYTQRCRPHHCHDPV